MARTDTLGHFLTDVADAIREKTGSSDTITASDFDTEIENIPSGGDPSEYFLSVNAGGYSNDSPLLSAIKKIPEISPSGTSLEYSFKYARGLQYVKIINNANVTSISSIFNYCTSLQTAIFDETFTNLTKCNGAFYKCESITSVPLFDTSHVTIMSNMFYGCKLLTTIPQYNTSSCTNFDSMFSGCTVINNIPTLDTSSGTSFSQIFQDCKALTSLPPIDLSGATNITQLCYNCNHLTTVPTFDLSSVTTMSYVFTNCSALTNDSLNNIMASLLSATSFSGTKTLKNIGLSSSQATTCTGLSNWSALSAAGWTTGY